jgi:hypothetical protein
MAATLRRIGLIALAALFFLDAVALAMGHFLRAWRRQPMPW